MAVNRYVDLYPLMTPELPGCTEPMMLQALQRSMRQFCIDTEAWWETLASVNLVEDQTEYNINSTWDAEIKRIKELRINTEDNIAAGNDGAIQDHELYEFITPDALILDDNLKPAEDVTGGLEIEVRIVPSITATSVDPTFLNDWIDAILGWAMNYLMSMTHKKWSNPDRSAYYMMQYLKGVSTAKSEKVRKRREGHFGLTA